jgi:hypothetical protein
MTSETMASRHRLIGSGNHSQVYRHRDSRYVLQVFHPDAPELTVDKVRREYAYLRRLFDPILPDLVPAQRLLLPRPDAPLVQAILVKDYVDIAPGWSLRTATRESLPLPALDQLAVFLHAVRELLIDTAAGDDPAAAPLIPDFIDPPLENLAVDTRGRLRLLDTNRLISTAKLREQREQGRLLTGDCPGVAARIFRLMFRRLMFLQHRFLGTPAAELRADQLLLRYLHPSTFDRLFADSAAAGEPFSCSNCGSPMERA